MAPAASSTWTKENTPLPGTDDRIFLFPYLLGDAPTVRIMIGSRTIKEPVAQRYPFGMGNTEHPLLNLGVGPDTSRDPGRSVPGLQGSVSTARPVPGRVEEPCGLHNVALHTCRLGGIVDVTSTFKPHPMVSFGSRAHVFRRVAFGQRRGRL